MGCAVLWPSVASVAQGVALPHAGAAAVSLSALVSIWQTLGALKLIVMRRAVCQR